MRHVVLGHWKPGFKKIVLNHMLRNRAQLSLSAAKSVVDRVLAGEEVLVEISDEAVDEFIGEAQQCGVDARAIESIASDESKSPARA